MNVGIDPSECFKKAARDAHNLLIDNRAEIRELEGKVRLMSEGYETKFVVNGGGISWFMGPKEEHQQQPVPENLNEINCETCRLYSECHGQKRLCSNIVLAGRGLNKNE